MPVAFLEKEGTNSRGRLILFMLGAWHAPGQAERVTQNLLSRSALGSGFDDDGSSPVAHAYDERIIELNRMLFAVYADDERRHRSLARGRRIGSAHGHCLCRCPCRLARACDEAGRHYAPGDGRASDA